MTLGIMAVTTVDIMVDITAVITDGTTEDGITHGITAVSIIRGITVDGMTRGTTAVSTTLGIMLDIITLGITADTTTHGITDGTEAGDHIIPIITIIT